MGQKRGASDVRHGDSASSALSVAVGGRTVQCDHCLGDFNKNTVLVQEVKLPRKQLYRARAHSNPLNDQFFDVPLSPAEAPWCVRACRSCSLNRFFVS